MNLAPYLKEKALVLLLAGVGFVVGFRFFSADVLHLLRADIEDSTSCGDAIVNETEECDDANAHAGDGCSDTCHIESGWYCFIEGQEGCITHCGDGIVSGSEQCDDYNAVSGDGCSSACTIEPGFACSPSTEITTIPACSDGVDNDNDGLIDAEDPGCIDTQDSTERSAEIHVATSGNDANTGSGTSPLASLQEAQTRVRALLTQSGGQQEDVTVVVHAGSYQLTDEMTWNVLDSGQNGYSVIYRDMPGEIEDPIFTTAETLDPNQWSVWSGSILSYPLASGQQFYTIYEGDSRGVIAQEPDWDPVTHLGLMYEIDGNQMRSLNESSKTMFRFYTNDLVPEIDYSNVRVQMWHSDWYENIVRIDAVNFVDNIVTLQDPTNYDIPQANTNLGDNKYRLINSLDFLDEPGEFFIDPTTSTLYYWPYNPANVTEGKIVIPTTLNTFRITGQSGTNPVRNLVIQGLRLEYTDFTDVLAGDDGARGPLGALLMTSFADNLTIRNMQLRMAGDRALYAGPNISNSMIKRNVIENTGFNGMNLGGSGMTIVENSLTKVGQVHMTARGINAVLDDSTMARNTVSDIAYSAITYRGTHSLLEKNDISNFLNVTADGGGIYMHTTATNQFESGENTVQQNFIHDYRTYIPNRHAYGLYLDGAGGLRNLYRNNIIQSPLAGRQAALTVSGNNNNFINNFFDNLDATNGLQSDVQIVDVTGNRTSGNRFFRNLLIKRNTLDHTVWKLGMYTDSGSLAMQSNMSSDYNFISTDASTNFVGLSGAAKILWQDWRNLTPNDANSEEGGVFFDPSATNQYTLIADSRPLQYGIQQIPFDFGVNAALPESTNICSITCGDGVVLGDEVCDDGLQNGEPLQCNTSCSGITSAVCGNGVIEQNEVCDDGSSNGQSGFCNDTCSDFTPSSSSSSASSDPSGFGESSDASSDPASSASSDSSLPSGSGSSTSSDSSFSSDTSSSSDVSSSASDATSSSAFSSSISSSSSAGEGGASGTSSSSSSQQVSSNQQYSSPFRPASPYVSSQAASLPPSTVPDTTLTPEQYYALGQASLSSSASVRSSASSGGPTIVIGTVENTPSSTASVTESTSSSSISSGTVASVASASSVPPSSLPSSMYVPRIFVTQNGDPSHAAAQPTHESNVGGLQAALHAGAQSSASIAFESIPTPARTETGPGLIVFLASGAAAGAAFGRRKPRQKSRA